MKFEVILQVFFLQVPSNVLSQQQNWQWQFNLSVCQFVSD